MVVDYQKSQIYKIINDALPDLVYYGSTSNTLSKRFGQHKCKSSNTCTSKQLFNCDVKPQIFLVENYPCNSKIELKARERWYIENNECVNKQVPNRTQKEYALENKDKIKDYKKEHYQDNKEQISKQIKQYQLDNKEQIKLQRAKHYQDNKERILAKAKQYKIDNKEMVKEKRALFYQKHKK
tara:strand:- start:858 stop:1403 length:546 start_codon:yes stop_codon:yes gene_type:complete